MVSMNTSTASASALQNIRNINAATEKVQLRLSTGLRISQARDNAAFWSVATALRSDLITSTAIREGLYTSAATVDIAYNAHRMTTDLLISYRGKIIDAIRGVLSREYAQKEIESIKSQLASVASSASIFGQNWVAIDSSAASFQPIRTIVSSMGPLLQNASQAGTIEIDAKTLALLDKNSSGGGILDTPKRPVPETVSDRLILGTVHVPAKPATVRYEFSLADMQPDRKIYFQVEYDGTVTPDGSWPGVLVPLGGYASVPEFATALGAEMGGYANVTVVPGESAVIISTKTAGHGSSISIRQVVVYKDGGYTRDTSDPLERHVPIEGEDGRDAVPFLAASASVPFAEPFSLAVDQSIAFTLTVDSRSSRRVIINKTLVDLATGRDDGRVANVLEFQRVMQSAIDPVGDAGVMIDMQPEGIQIRSSALSGPTKIAIADVSITPSASVMRIQIVSKSDEELRSYVSAVERAINATIVASTYLGALSSRISSQSSFILNISDAIQKSISSLVDADMQEDTMKLRALLVRQELSMRSMAITNVTMRNLLGLFQRP